MQSVVSGQAPKTLERNIISGEKKKIHKTVDIITETNRTLYLRQKDTIAVAKTSDS